ncbi:hypothetical protein [Bacillus phage vB_BanS-Thrax3]|nr:hypothetical protein [Bacillus phage vB_BanS-Thrax1]UUV46478.1 hypothetical protein [Bacillus phage vB_BanS-Thrax3]
MQPQYEIGEIVEIIDDSNGHLFEIGEHVRIRTLHFHGGVASAESLDGTVFWFLDEDDIKKIEE